MKRARYNKEFKISSVKYALSSVQSVKEVSVELGVSSGTLRRWMNEYDEYGESAFPGHRSALFNSDYEIRKLKRENVDLKMELEILKKLQAFSKRKNV